MPALGHNILHHALNGPRNHIVGRDLIRLRRLKQFKVSEVVATSNQQGKWCVNPVLFNLRSKVTHGDSDSRLVGPIHIGTVHDADMVQG